MDRPAWDPAIMTLVQLQCPPSVGNDPPEATVLLLVVSETLPSSSHRTLCFRWWRAFPISKACYFDPSPTGRQVTLQTKVPHFPGGQADWSDNTVRRPERVTCLSIHSERGHKCCVIRRFFTGMWDQRLVDQGIRRLRKEWPVLSWTFSAYLGAPGGVAWTCCELSKSIQCPGGLTSSFIPSNWKLDDS